MAKTNDGRPGRKPGVRNGGDSNDSASLSAAALAPVATVAAMAGGRSRRGEEVTRLSASDLMASSAGLASSSLGVFGRETRSRSGSAAGSRASMRGGESPAPIEPTVVTFAGKPFHPSDFKFGQNERRPQTPACIVKVFR